jgi:hypothetical protein
VADGQAERAPTGASIRELLAHYDRKVGDAFADTTATTTGTERVQALHILGRLINQHDSVVGSTLCPLLQDLPGGPAVAEGLRRGCAQREALLARFQSLRQGSTAHNVYPAFGTEIEAILAELEKSFDQHVDDETTRVGELLESAADSISPEVVAARIAIGAKRAPARAHRLAYRHPSSKALRAVYRTIDRVHEWNDSHHGWPAARSQAPPPVRPPRQFTRRPPSVLELLSGYDQTVEAVIEELERADRDGPSRAAAAYRLAAAIAVHDSIVGGTLCPLLESVSDTSADTAVLQGGCRERAQLLEAWNQLMRKASTEDLFDDHAEESHRIIDGLVASFSAHETSETDHISKAIEHLRERPWKSSGTGLISPYLLPDWPNPEPGVLAAHMALWAEKAPTHAHPLLRRHPTNRLLRDVYRRADHLRDRRRTHRGWPTLT